MNTETIQQFKKILEEKKSQLENELSSFSKKDPNLKGDYDADFPDYGAQSIDESATEVESYENAISTEQLLETELKKINQALERIEKGTYGYCENCKKEIPIERLKALPEADTCLDCE